jgi:hypothetical protein
MTKQNVTTGQIVWMLFKAPFLGAMFCIFLPVIGIVVTTAFVLEKLVGFARKVDKHTTKLTS